MTPTQKRLQWTRQVARPDPELPGSSGPNVRAFDITLRPAEEPGHEWTLRIQYIENGAGAASSVASVKLTPADHDAEWAAPESILQQLAPRRLKMFVNSDRRSRRRFRDTYIDPIEPNPAHRPPLGPSVWIERAEDVINAIDTVEEYNSDESTHDGPPMSVTQELREVWKGDFPNTSGWADSKQVQNRLDALRKKGYLTGSIREGTLDYGPNYPEST